METEQGKKNLLQFADKIGFDVGENAAQNIEVQFQKIFDFLPELCLLLPT